jgi:hypothetical protein
LKDIKLILITKIKITTKKMSKIFLIILIVGIYSYKSDLNIGNYIDNFNINFNILKNKNIDLEIDMKTNENKKMINEYQYLIEVLEYNQINKQLLIDKGLYNKTMLTDTVNKLINLKKKINEKIDIQK